MTSLESPEIRRGSYILLITFALSFLPLVLPFASFLWLPGALVNTLLFGARVAITTRWLRVLTNVLLWPILLYGGAALWQWGEARKGAPNTGAARAVFVFWVALLLPWLLFAGLSGMAFDGGYTPAAYGFFWSVWLYPVTVGLVALFRRWFAWAVFLPLLNFTGCFAAGLLPHR